MFYNDDILKNQIDKKMNNDNKKLNYNESNINKTNQKNENDNSMQINHQRLNMLNNTVQFVNETFVNENINLILKNSNQPYQTNNLDLEVRFYDITRNNVTEIEYKKEKIKKDYFNMQNGKKICEFKKVIKNGISVNNESEKQIHEEKCKDNLNNLYRIEEMKNMETEQNSLQKTVKSEVQKLTQKRTENIDENLGLTKIYKNKFDEEECCNNYQEDINKYYNVINNDDVNQKVKNCDSSCYTEKEIVDDENKHGNHQNIVINRFTLMNGQVKNEFSTLDKIENVEKNKMQNKNLYEKDTRNIVSKKDQQKNDIKKYCYKTENIKKNVFYNEEICQQEIQNVFATTKELDNIINTRINKIIETSKDYSLKSKMKDMKFLKQNNYEHNFFSSPIRSITNKRKHSISEHDDNVLSKRTRIMLQNKRHENKNSVTQNNGNLFFDSFAGINQKRKNKAKSNFAFSEGEMFIKNDVINFSNNSFVVNIQMIREKFKSKYADRNFELQAINYLKAFVISTPSINKTKIRPELYPSDDPVINYEQKETKTAFEMLSLFVTSKTNGNIDFLFFFSTKEISNLVQQLTNDGNAATKRIYNIIEAIINATNIYNQVIKNTLQNEIILYIEDQRHYKGTNELLSLCNLLLTKNEYKESEISDLLETCLLSLLRAKAIEIVQENIIQQIFCLVIKTEPNFVSLIFSFFCKYFETSYTRSKTIILHLILKIIKDVEFDFSQSSRYFCNILNYVFLSENHCFIECVFSMFVDNETCDVIERNVNLITSHIFNSLFNLSKRYWNVKGKSNVYIILQRIMNFDTTLFNKCLTEYNKTQEKAELEKNFNDEITKYLFESCLDNFDAEEIMKMRKRSVISIESDDFDM